MRRFIIGMIAGAVLAMGGYAFAQTQSSVITYGPHSVDWVDSAGGVVAKIYRPDNIGLYLQDRDEIVIDGGNGVEIYGNGDDVTLHHDELVARGVIVRPDDFPGPIPTNGARIFIDGDLLKAKLQGYPAVVLKDLNP